MKKTGILIAVIVMLTACQHNEDRSDAYGTFRADKVMVSAQANGQLIYNAIEEGAVVDQDHLMAIVDTTDYQLQVLQLQQTVKATATRINQIDAQEQVQQQQKDNLLTDLARVRNLIKGGAATQKQLDDLQGAIALTEKQIQATQTRKNTVLAEIDNLNIQIDRAKEALKNCMVYNPVKGTVLTKLMYNGETATFGKPLYAIADMKNLNLKVFVSGEQLQNIKPGQKAEVLIDGTKGKLKTMEGTVVKIAENAEFTPKIIQTREERVKLVYAVEVKVKNDGTLKIGMPGEVNFK